jgi:hypothetical protein
MLVAVLKQIQKDGPTAMVTIRKQEQRSKLQKKKKENKKRRKTRDLFVSSAKNSCRLTIRVKRPSR